MIEYFTIKNFLSKDDCEKIVEFSKNNLSLNDAKIGNGTYDIIKRKSKISFSNYDKIVPELSKKLSDEISNEFKLKGYIVEFENQNYQFTKYEIGGHFDWHRDSAETGIYANRFCSIVIILNNEYTGGELEINTELNGDESIITLDNSIGNLHVFLSQVLHRVKPIEAGVRYSLVSWFSVKPINNFAKSLI